MSGADSLTPDERFPGREVDQRGNCSKCGGTHYGTGPYCPMSAEPSKPSSAPKLLTHADSWLSDGRTLCGLVQEGDVALGIDPPRIGLRGDHLDCEDCLLAIRRVYARYTVNGRIR